MREAELIEVVCAVIVAGGRVLACQRAEDRHLAGCWEFPGGKVEPGESLREALVREIGEELGCTVAVGEALEPVEQIHDDPRVAIRLRPFFCALCEGEPEALEHAALQWVERERLGEVAWAPADLRVARMIG